ncbi:MAG: tetratricopeptide repeat protein [Deltaproteobacteria bacterium]|nr:tetratricopeptide repeat protein [Deltaproteobacteria bacterium]
MSPLHRLTRRLTLTLALGLPAVASAQDVPLINPPPAGRNAERVAGVTAEEMAAYEAALARFRERSTEFSGDARAIVDQIEREERAELDFAYGPLLTELEVEQRRLRDESIRRFEAFLVRYPSTEYSATVMFRLADLYFDVAGEDYLREMDERTALEDRLTMEQRFELPPPPAKDLSRSIALYRRILAEYPNFEYTDGTLYMLGYCYGETSTDIEMDAEELSKGYYEQLVTRFPESRLAIDGNFALGMYHFDNYNVKLALEHFRKVTERADKEHALYDRGMYMLAWSQYRLSDYEGAFDTFTRLLDFSLEYYKESGKDSNMKPDALEYLAISMIDVAKNSESFSDPNWRKYSTDPLMSSGQLLAATGYGLNPAGPIQVFDLWFNKVGRREYEVEVIKTLAAKLEEASYAEDAIATYEYIQQKWPTDPENPDFQYRISQLYISGVAVRDDAAADAALAKLGEMYNDDSAWAAANRNNPDALAKAQAYQEQSLYSVATGLHARAQQTGSVADYSMAADRYREYLNKFPFANQYYQTQFYLAEALFSSERFEEAIVEYDALLKVPGEEWTEAAQVRIFVSWFNLLNQRYGDLQKLPPDAVVERTEETKSGEQRNIYMLSDLHKEFIKSADAMKTASFKNETWETARKENLSVYYYLPAQIYIVHGHHEEGRKRMEEVITLYRRTIEASYAANYIVTSYIAEGDLENVAKYSAYYRMMTDLGADERTGAAALAETFGNIEADAQFKLAMKLKEVDPLKAAKAFEDYLVQYPKAPDVNLKSALYNAANQYEIGGKADTANELFERFINKYPKDELSPPLYFRIATNYASVLELNKSVEYYERLYKNFPTSPDAPAALYMAGFLRTGLGDHKGAAQNFMTYVEKLPPQPDSEAVYWLAGQQWQLVGDKEALSFYRRYLQRFPDSSPDHVMEAYHFIAKYYERTGDKRAAEQAWKDITTNYARLAAKGTLGPKARNIGAEAAFRDMQVAYNNFIKVSYPKKDEDLIKYLLEDKPKEFAAITQMELALITTYQDFEYSSAALYISGATFIAWADMFYKAPAPPEIAADEDLLAAYREELDKLGRPAEDKGISRLQANLQKSKDEKRASVWIDKTIAMLNDRDPLNYPLEKAEVRGQSTASVLPTAGPLDMPVPEPVVTPATPAPAPTTPAPGTP